MAGGEQELRGPKVLYRLLLGPVIGEWPNIVILFACLAGMLFCGEFVGRSPLECFGDRADAWLVRLVRQQRPAKPRANAGLHDCRIAALADLGDGGAPRPILLRLGFNPFG